MQTLTIPALRHAIETRDGAALAGFYADDARLSIIDHLNPPSQPQEITGAAAIAAYYDSVCGQVMAHRIDSAILDGNTGAFTQTCTYPDGKRVFCAASLELRDGKVVRQTSIQAWDP